jgi:polyisoprenoid-binding protein YceI
MGCVEELADGVTAQASEAASDSRGIRWVRRVWALWSLMRRDGNELPRLQIDALIVQLRVVFVSLAIAVMSPVSSAHWPQQSVAAVSSHEIVLTVDPGQSKLHWTLGTTLHTVHGTFALKRGTVRADTASNKVSGEIVADAASGDSGNSSRDKKMHNEILESQRYTEVVFRPDKVIGNIEAKGSSAVQIHGTFLLHGSEHELTVPVQVELTSNQWKGTAKFEIPYIQWGLKNPSSFLLKTDPAVDIEIELAGSLGSSQ